MKSKYFESVGVVGKYRLLRDRLDWDKKGEFEAALFRVWREKQFSPDELPTFKITMQDLLDTYEKNFAHADKIGV